MPAEIKLRVWQQHSGHRSRIITKALVDGGKAIGWNAEEHEAGSYRGVQNDDGDVAAMYGYHGRLVSIFSERVQVGRPVVYIDLGYWGRRAGGNWVGFHKVSVNDRHPTAYFMNKQHGGGRFHVHRVPIKPWKQDGKAILLAGMGPKAAHVAGFPFEQWERWAIDELRKYTDRPIIYRPKPSHVKHSGMAYLAGTEPSDPRSESLEQCLDKCWACVSHHSNTAVDAILYGVPAFTWDGVAKPMSLQDLSRIEKPWRPDGREAWAANIAYCQWSVGEIASGAMWRHLLGEGLIP